MTEKELQVVRNEAMLSAVKIILSGAMTPQELLEIVIKDLKQLKEGSCNILA